MQSWFVIQQGPDNFIAWSRDPAYHATQMGPSA